MAYVIGESIVHDVLTYNGIRTSDDVKIQYDENVLLCMEGQRFSAFWLVTPCRILETCI